MIELRSRKQISEEYLYQDFFEHVQSNGQIIMVSMDGRYFYRPQN